MSWQDDAMIEQERADALEYMGEAEWRNTFEDRHGWAPDYDYEVRKTNVDKEVMSKNISEYNKKYWAKHKEEISARRKVFYQEHKKEINERNKKWLEANRDKWNAYMRERRRKAKLDKQKDV